MPTCAVALRIFFSSRPPTREVSSGRGRNNVPVASARCTRLHTHMPLQRTVASLCLQVEKARHDDSFEAKLMHLQCPCASHVRAPSESPAPCVSLYERAELCVEMWDEEVCAECNGAHPRAFCPHDLRLSYARRCFGDRPRRFPRRGDPCAEVLLDCAMGPLQVV